ncbi:efflux RND transporter periplasmic adaptor subunit, partial [Geobacter sp.]|uniref:efflux RND transporter periplasmic adaptor subunit n=1 Tax=Geobacter sp. TaxID=46610 RepID=UPI00260651B6
MKKKGIIIGVILALVLGGAFVYRFTHLTTGKGEEQAGKKEGGELKEEGKKVKEEEHKEAASVKMDPETQKKSGVVVAAASKKSLGGVITVTGKVEVNADRIAHVSPRISGKIVAVGASLGDNIGAGQVLARLDSVELGEALNRYHQSKTKLALAEKNMERVKTLVEKKIAARKEILQAETDYQTALTELHTDEERLLLYGLSRSNLTSINGKRILLPVRSPIAGVITEKHAIVGELADPSKSLYTVADLSTVWVMVDINEKDLAKVRKGQAATVTVGAFPDTKFRGRITHIADIVDEATRTVKARVEVQNPGRKLKPEMFATVELTLPATAPPVLAVPEEAFQELERKKVLFVT